MARGGVGRRALAVFAGAHASLSGCSGEAFHLADPAPLGSVPDAGRLAALVIDSTLPDTGLPLDGRDASGAVADSGAAPLPPAASPCGAVRAADSSLADDEVCVQAGTFSMGSSEASKPGYFAHGPVHAVTLSAFLIDAYEVTVARYRRCVEAGACGAPGSNPVQGCTYTLLAQDHELHPVTCLSWQSAQDFCGWDGGRHLPTEAQWEQAARTAAGSRYPWGDTFSCERAVLAGASQCSIYNGQLPQPVGSAPAGASPEQVFDLAGNTAEWVGDWFGNYPATAVSDPPGSATGSARIQRGGSWLTPAADATSHARRGEAPAAVGPFSFRCARSAEP